MKKILFCFAFIISLPSIAQDDYYRSESAGERVGFYGRGMIAGGFLLEDIWLRHIAVGGEVRFFEQLGIAFDISHFRWRLEEEVYTDPNDYDKYDEYSQYDSRNSLCLQLRYFPTFLEFSPARIYLSSFHKYGQRWIRHESGYPIDVGDMDKQYGYFYDNGGVLGVTFGDDFGIDINMGASYRKEIMNVHELQGNGTYGLSKTEHHRWVVTARAMLFVWF